METTFIYALNDPETGECRYVGKADDPKGRLVRHISEGRSPSNKKPCHRTNWIKALLARGLYPVLEVLDEVPKSEHQLWERAWISASRKIGMDLVNGSDGGDGGCNPTPEVRAKISAFHKGRKFSLEHRAKIKAARAKQIFTPESNAKRALAATGKKRSPETCAKISAAQKGRPFSPEHRANSIAALRGRKLSPQHVVKMRVKRPGASSKFHGVDWSKKRRKWRSNVRVSGKCFHVGEFLGEIEAAKAYDIAAKKYCGALAVLNFPNE